MIYFIHPLGPLILNLSLSGQMTWFVKIKRKKILLNGKYEIYMQGIKEKDGEVQNPGFKVAIGKSIRTTIEYANHRDFKVISQYSF